MRQRTVPSTDEVVLAVQEFGSPGGIPVVIVNGPGADHRAWRGFIAEFSDRFRILTWDYRGLYGSSPPNDRARVEVRDHVHDLFAVLDEAGVDACVFLSWSLGQQVVLEGWRRRPEAFLAMISVNGSYGRPFERSHHIRGASSLNRWARWIPARGERLQQMVRWLDDYPVMLDLMKTAGLLSPALDRNRFVELADAFRSLDMPLYRAMLDAFGRHDAEDLLPTVRCPALFFAGARDPLMPSRYSVHMARRVLESELQLIPIGSHYIPIEFAEFLNLRVEDFLDRRLQAARS
jgi:pimeloyl-ACP methyl ester carboxylesterase